MSQMESFTENRYPERDDMRENYVKELQAMLSRSETYMNPDPYRNERIVSSFFVIFVLLNVRTNFSIPARAIMPLQVSLALI